MPVVGSEFSPPRWLSNPHAQTLLASRAVRPPPPPTRRERLELDDGDFLDLAHGGDALPGDAPVVALFHGLAGSIDSAYARGAIAALGARGFRTCLMHWRGCSGEPNRLRRSYHSGASDDVGRIVDTLRARHPRSALYAAGFSLGGNALLKYLGERGERTPLAGALAVSPPLVLAVGAEQLDRGFARIYRGHLLGLMRAQHEAKRARHPELGLPPAPPSLDTFRKFDDALTAPLHGFAGVDDYYARCSARAYLGGIRRPTRILSARDDPFFTEAILPGADELAPDTTLELAERGGHVGFLAAATRGRPAEGPAEGPSTDAASAVGLPGGRSPAGARPRPPPLHRWLDGHVAGVLADMHRARGRGARPGTPRRAPT